MKRNTLSRIVAEIGGDKVRANLERWIANNDLNMIKLRRMKLKDLQYRLGKMALLALYNELWINRKDMPWMTEFEEKENSRLSPDTVVGHDYIPTEHDWLKIESCMEKIAACAKPTAIFVIRSIKSSRSACVAVYDAFPPKLEVRKRKHMLYLMNQRLLNCSVPFRLRYHKSEIGIDLIDIVKK